MATVSKTRPPRDGARTHIQPLDDHLLVRADDPDETTAGGLVIPDTDRAKPQRGAVVAVGPGRRSELTGERIPLDLEAGSTVVFSNSCGTEISDDGEDLLILAARDVMAVVAEKGTK
jgi:chaperonin GroES